MALFNDGYWLFAAFEVEGPGVCRDILCIVGVLFHAFAPDGFALARQFGRFLGKGLCGCLLGRCLGGGHFCGSLLGYFAVLDG
jgi:hypothetical protein